jgi:hypothetical protein
LFPDEGLLTVVPGIVSKVEVVKMLRSGRRIKQLSNHVGYLSEKMRGFDWLGVAINQH